MIRPTHLSSKQGVLAYPYLQRPGLFLLADLSASIRWQVVGFLARLPSCLEAFLRSHTSKVRLHQVAFLAATPSCLLSPEQLLVTQLARP